MRVLRVLLQFIVYSLSMPLLCMEQSTQWSDWPTLVFVHHQEPTTVSSGPLSFTVSKGSIRSTYPLTPVVEELSPMQKIHLQLFEKDRAGNKEDFGPLILNQSRFMQFIEQRDQIINTCIECFYSITARLQLISLSFNIFNEPELSEDINKIFHPFLEAIIEVL